MKCPTVKVSLQPISASVKVISLQSVTAIVMASLQPISAIQMRARAVQMTARVLSEGSPNKSVLSSSTWTTESGSSFDSKCDRSVSKLSKTLQEFHTPLYEDADLAILSLRHCTTQMTFSELISLVDSHVPKDAKSVAALYKLRKFFETKFNDLGSQLYNTMQNATGCWKILN